jgi:hypothetical protein
MSIRNEVLNVLHGDECNLCDDGPTILSGHMQTSNEM